MRTCFAALLVLFCLGQITPAHAEGEQNLQFRIHNAIRTGTNWLKKKQLPEGIFGESAGPTYGGGGNAYHNKPGLTAFALFTLLKCEVKTTDPVILKGFAWLRKCDPKGTYEQAVCILAIETLYDRALKEYASKKHKKDMVKRDRWLKKKYALYAMRGSAQGQKDIRWVQKLVKKLCGFQNEQQGWRYGDLQGNAGKHDVSATQFALFGLKSATRCGVPVSKAVMYGGTKYLLDCQEKDGQAAVGNVQGAKDSKGSFVPMKGDKARGFPYMTDGEPREKRPMGGMTAAALVGLIIGKSELQKTAYWRAIGKQTDKAIFDGLAWLNNNYTVQTNPYGFRGHYYYLYALERVGILGGLTLIGSHNWYIDGAKYLVAAQRPQDKDHGWWDVKQEIAPSDLINTCYALLFLKKATIPVGVTITRMGK